MQLAAFTLEALFSHKWAIFIYGWFVWNLIFWWIEKEKADKAGEKFDFGKYAYQHLDNWVVTLFVALPIATNGPDIHSFIMGFVPESFRFEWKDGFYAGAGPFVEGIYFFVTEGIPMIKKAGLEYLRKKVNRAVQDPGKPAQSDNQQGSDETPS